LSRSRFRHPGEKIRRGRRNDDKIGGAREFDMPDCRLVGQAEQIVPDGRAAESRRRKGGNELPRGGGHDDLNGGATVFEAPNQLQGFVGRNSSAYDQENAGAGHRDAGHAGWPAIKACICVFIRFLPPPRHPVRGSSCITNDAR
jgi:hypothetical protein